MDQEKQNIEYKETWRDEYLNTICAFANASGGRLFLGINDFGQVIGTEYSQHLLEALPSKIRDALGIVVDVNMLEKNEKQYIEIIVPAYPVAISCKGNYYYRSGSTTQKLTGVELESFILRKRGATWDHMPHPGVSIDVLDSKTITHFKQLAMRKQRIDSKVLEDNVEILLNKLHLLNHGYLTNAAMLLFTKDPEKYYPGAFIKIGYFENNADLIYQDEIHGSLFEQVDKAIELIYFKYMKAKISYMGLQRVEQYFVTEECMREAILNAVVHKQYESGIPIQISVYEDKLYIGNIGQLPLNWTIHNLYSKHNSTPYNPLIAHVFYLAGQIESWGRGVEKMCESCQKNNLPLPIYHINPTDIMIQFNATNQHPSSITQNKTLDHNSLDNHTKITNILTKVTVNEKNGTVNEKNGTVNSNKVTVNEKKGTVNSDMVTVNDEKGTVNSNKVTVNGEKGTVNDMKDYQLDNKEAKILQCLLENPNFTYDDISVELCFSRKTIAYNISKLKNKGFITRIGSAKKGYWKVMKKHHLN